MQIAHQRAVEAERRIMGLVEEKETLEMALNESLQYYTVAKFNKTARANIYERKTKKRFPLRTVKVPIEEEARRAIESLFDGEARLFFNERFKHEIKRITGAI